MRDVYLHPTVESLAQHLASVPREQTVARLERKPLRIPLSLEYYGCGPLQILFYTGYGFLIAALFTAALRWLIVPDLSAIEVYLRLARDQELGFGSAPASGISPSFSRTQDSE
jgi:hypothetical protein